MLKMFCAGQCCGGTERLVLDQKLVDSHHEKRGTGSELAAARFQREFLSILVHVDVPSKHFLGQANRKIAETPMNQRSSRSHAVFTIYLSAKKKNSDVIVK